MLGTHDRILFTVNKTCETWDEYQTLDEYLDNFTYTIADDDNPICTGYLYSFNETKNFFNLKY